ncbi:MAG: PIN domain-containing protein [Solirubrobacterales bacterium]
MIVIDTSAILAFMNSGDTHHDAVAEWLLGETDELVTTPLILAEADHLVGARGGSGARAALRADLVAGAYLVDWWQGALRTAVTVAERYADADLSLADASLVALAERVETVTVATLDRRHFLAVAPLAGGPAFQLRP